MRLARELERQSITDQLTGLYNRNYLEINSDVVHDDDDYPISLLMLDCNYLKQTNDRLGHAAGDRLLKRVAQVIKENMPSERAIAARLGGDEFCIACGRMDEQGIRELTKAVERGCARVSDDELTVDVSMGYATMPDASGDPEAMFRIADQAMYEAKKRMHAEREQQASGIAFRCWACFCVRYNRQSVAEAVCEKTPPTSMSRSWRRFPLRRYGLRRYAVMPPSTISCVPVT